VTRVEELTLRWLDGLADAAEQDELATLVETDAEARRIHLSLVDIEVSLRGRRPAPVWAAVMDRIQAERTDVTVWAVMHHISTVKPVVRGPRAAPSRMPRRAGTVLVGAAALAAAVIGARAFWSEAVPQRLRAPDSIETPLRAASAPIEIVRFDFEDGRLPGTFAEGRVVRAPCPPGSAFCVLATESARDPGHLSVSVGQTQPPLFAFAPNQVLRFDYWAAADAPAIEVQLRSRGGEPFGIALRDITRERWARAEVRLVDLAGAAGRRLAAGDELEGIAISNGRPDGAPFYLDNLRVSAFPKDASLPPTRATITISR
jgi:hypothetical protein